MTNQLEDFIQQLSLRLEALPEAERTSAINYYRNFIQSSPNQEEALKSLGTPSDVAAEIFTSYVKKTSINQTPQLMPGAEPMPNGGHARVHHSGATHTGGHAGMHHGRAAPAYTPWYKNKMLVILILIFVLPIGLPLAIGLGGGAIGLIAGIGTVILTLLIYGFVMVATGIASAALSVFILMSDTNFGLIAAGTGLVFLGLGIVLVRFAFMIVRGIFSAIGKLVRRVTHGRPHTA